MIRSGQYSNYSHTVELLTNWFKKRISRETVIMVVDQCGGNMFESVKIIKNMTKASFAQTLNQPPSSQNTGAIPKQISNSVNANFIPVINDSTTQVKDIMSNYSNHYRVLIIMRGAPGSGKSYLAKQIVKLTVGDDVNNYSKHICSTDDFFMNGTHYAYDRNQLHEAHSWNQTRTLNLIKKGECLIIVDNTNIHFWEMEPYVRAGVRNGYIIEIVEPNTPWAMNPIQLSKKNKHSVPVNTIRRMLDTYESISGEEIIKFYNLSYSPNMKPPVTGLINLGEPSKYTYMKPIQTQHYMEKLKRKDSNTFRNLEKPSNVSVETASSGTSMEKGDTELSDINRDKNKVIPATPTQTFMEIKSHMEQSVVILDRENTISDKENTILQAEKENLSDTNIEPKFRKRQKKGKTMLNHHIEQSFVIAENQYSDNCLKIKKICHGKQDGNGHVDQIDHIKDPASSINDNQTDMKASSQDARQLAEKEEKPAQAGEEPEMSNFKEITDLDFAIALYEKDVEEWRNKNSDNLDENMTKEKLYNLFPHVCQDTLSEMYKAHDYNFKETVAVLLNSTGQGHIVDEDNGVHKFIFKKEMERQKKVLEEEKKASSQVGWSLFPGKTNIEMDDVNKYRELANKHLDERNDNLRKAQDYMKLGLTEAANHYSSVAEFHSQKYEQNNSLAAASLIQVNAINCHDNNTIDLHYLRVREAKESLDLFIDTHIQQLREKEKRGPSGYRELFFITGRGLHSIGKAKLKPAVQLRLRRRGFTYIMRNPGLLSAKVYAVDKLTHQIT